MATSSSPLSFGDCFSVLDRALASTRGIRLRFPTEGDARHFRTRLHAARQLHRNANAQTYEHDHAMYGNSEYDALVIKMRCAEVGATDGEWLLLIEKVERVLEIEEIAPIEDSP